MSSIERAGGAKTRIEGLTRDQVARMAEYRETFLGHGLSCEPADRPKAEDAVLRAYAGAGLPPPKVLVWMSSPFYGLLATYMLKSKKDFLASNGDGKSQTRIVKTKSVGQVRDQVRGQVGDQVGDQVWDQVRDQVWDQVRGQVWGQVWDQVRGQVRDLLNTAGYGSHDAGWLSFYAFFRDVCGLAVCKRLTPLIDLCASVGWLWPRRGVCVLTDRPALLRRDERHRLHCADGPALAYRDGVVLHCWHGVRVPSWFVENPERITAEAVFAEKNQELRRCLMEIMGRERVLADLGDRKRLISSDDNLGQPRRLWHVDYGATEPMAICEVMNGTLEPDGSRKAYFLLVPPDVDTPHAAVAWSYGVDPRAYVEGIRT